MNLRANWAEFLDKFEPWDWYCTLTFRDEIHPEKANKRYLKFIRLINESIYGRRYRERGQGIYHVKALEWQKRGVLHFHSLMGGGVSRLRRLSLMDNWNWHNGFARIEQYDPKLGARRYLSKYVVKGGDLDFCFPRDMWMWFADNGANKVEMGKEP